MRPALNYCAASVAMALLTGCAGPMSPFGSFPLNQHKASWLEKPVSVTRSRARVRFSPEHQVLHGPANFSVVIEDPEGIPENYKLAINYNGMDVTQTFLSHAQVLSMDPLNHEIRLFTKDFRLLPSRENLVQVAYYRDGVEKSATAQYQPPICSAFTANQMVFSVPEFDPPLSVLQLINQTAQKKNLNPFFVAALVAQESSFNPHALSSTKALGLTQVTSLGESEIMRRVEYWPRYPGIDLIPYPLLKLSILSGRIHSGNEWRLDPALSIEGGVEYLSYLSEYWKKADKRSQVEKKLGPSETALSEVMLASYNSGATRVGEALRSDGPKWLQNQELGEARNYVRRIVSYCDHFEHGDE